MEKIEIGGKKYDLDVDKAIKDGYLKEDKPFDFRLGIYKSIGYGSDVMVVEDRYYDLSVRKEQQTYLILSPYGSAWPNSELQKSLTKEEAINWLKKENYTFKKDIKP